MYLIALATTMICTVRLHPLLGLISNLSWSVLE